MSKKVKLIILLLITAISAEIFFSMEASEHTHEEQESDLIVNPDQDTSTQDIENETSRNFIENIYKKFASDYKMHKSSGKNFQIKQTSTISCFNFNNYSRKESFNYKRITESFRINHQYSNIWQRLNSQYCY
ncbi:MAG: hypothetical protein V1646_01070 [bacterium]